MAICSIHPLTAKDAAVFDDVIISRFWSKVDKRGPDECWPWLGSKHKRDGRGYWKYPGGSVAPRFSLTLAEGPPPDKSMHACHKCDNPPCVNPDHLWWGTNKQNMEDASAKGRLLFRTHCRNGHRLTPENVWHRVDRGWKARMCKACIGLRRNKRKPVIIPEDE